MVNRNPARSSDDDYDRVVVAVDIEECRDLMFACMVTRMRALGWSQQDASQACDRAIKKATDSLHQRLERVAAICGNAASEGAPERSIKMLARAEFALGGVEIADELNKSRISAMN